MKFIVYVMTSLIVACGNSTVATTPPISKTDDDAKKLEKIVDNSLSVKLSDKDYGVGHFGSIKLHIHDSSYRKLFLEASSLGPRVINFLKSQSVPNYYKGAIGPVLFCLGRDEFVNFLEHELIDIYEEGLIDDQIVDGFLKFSYLITDNIVNGYKDIKLQRAFQLYLNPKYGGRFQKAIETYIAGSRAYGGPMYVKPHELCLSQK